LDEHYPDEIWATEIVADGRVFVTTRRRLRPLRVKFGSPVRNRAVPFTLKNRRRQPGLSGPKSADFVAEVR